jgi:hypothetical protein
MPDLVITSVRIVEWVDKFDAPSNEVFAVGEAMRFHTDGTVTPANGTTTTEANFQGVATIESDRIGKAITVVRDGLLDVGEALVGLAPGAAIYVSDTDGTFGTTAGTTSVIAGRVEPGWGGTTADLLLRVRKGA